MNLFDFKIKVLELFFSGSLEFCSYLLVFWALIFTIGYYNWDLFFKKKNCFDLLGLCKRPKVLFYSGFYAKLKANNSLSATETACPGLACPQMTNAQIALNDRLSKILKSFSALNQINIDLVRVILAYQDYPSSIKKTQNITENLIIEETNIKEKTTLCIESLLNAHKNLNALFASQKNDLDNFKKDNLYQNSLNKLCSKVDPYAANLLKALSFNKAFELAQLPATAVATAYLACEAGKSLLFKKDDRIFHQISQFPQLQARAVLQSLESYFESYSGDSRLIIRQAILCAQRENTGILLLPENMPLSSQALRDLLEILYADLEDQQEISAAIELENLLLELYQNWLFSYESLLQKKENKNFRLGINYKSFILYPLKEMINLAFSNIDQNKFDRIKNLLKLENFSDSTRVSELKLPSDLSAEIQQKWLILRKALQKNNCLSGRIGENIVPVNSLIYSLVFLANEDGKEINIYGLENLVPLRKHKIEDSIAASILAEGLGKAVADQNIRIYLDKNKYKQALELEQDLLKNKQSPTVLSTIKYRRAL